MSTAEERAAHGDRDHIDFTGSEHHSPVLGKGTQNNYYGMSRVPAALPHQVGVIPARANCFQDRAEVARLQQALAGGGTAVVGQVLAGMGGVGKTQLAAPEAACSGSRPPSEPGANCHADRSSHGGDTFRP
ncbi:hypothetical protein [Streptomyces sp. NPDC002265]|uniref:hypothetical protein n=1 Tax=Streptomyces sp. NPDC002265 TaxID=3154415 RepID=UPI003322A1C9